MSDLYNFFQKIQSERILLNSLCKANITLIPKIDRAIYKKKKIRSVSLINTDTKMLKILSN